MSCKGKEKKSHQKYLFLNKLTSVAKNKKIREACEKVEPEKRKPKNVTTCPDNLPAATCATDNGAIPWTAASRYAEKTYCKGQKAPYFFEQKKRNNLEQKYSPYKDYEDALKQELLKQVTPELIESVLNNECNTCDGKLEEAKTESQNPPLLHPDDVWNDFIKSNRTNDIEMLSAFSENLYNACNRAISDQNQKLCLTSIPNNFNAAIKRGFLKIDASAVDNINKGIKNWETFYPDKDPKNSNTWGDSEKRISVRFFWELIELKRKQYENAPFLLKLKHVKFDNTCTMCYFQIIINNTLTAENRNAKLSEWVNDNFNYKPNDKLLELFKSQQQLKSDLKNLAEMPPESREGKGEEGINEKIAGINNQIADIEKKIQHNDTINDHDKRLKAHEGDAAGITHGDASAASSKTAAPPFAAGKGGDKRKSRKRTRKRRRRRKKYSKKSNRKLKKKSRKRKRKKRTRRRRRR